jgi:enoyl-CoA hydratase/carnithine racemase
LPSPAPYPLPAALSSPTTEQRPARVQRDGPLATIVIDHPPLNLFGEELVDAIAEAVDQVSSSDARALMIRAEGSVFTGGADVHTFEGGDPSEAKEGFAGGLGTIHRLEQLPIPTLSVVHALCLTAGLELSLACDMIWASESARFGLVEAVVGLTPGWGGTQRMAERAGPARAREFVMSAGLYDAATLERWNVINRVLPDDQLLEKATRFAQRLANGPTKAHAATKAVVQAVREGGIPEADRRTPEITAGLFETEDLRNGVESFLTDGPGKAKFKGR